MASHISCTEAYFLEDFKVSLHNVQDRLAQQGSMVKCGSKHIVLTLPLPAFFLHVTQVFTGLSERQSNVLAKSASLIHPLKILATPNLQAAVCPLSKLLISLSLSFTS